MAKIYYITNVKLPTEKAHGYQIVKTCEALAKAGVEVNLLIPERENYIKKDIFSFYEIERVFEVEYLHGFDFRKWEWWFKKGWFLLERLAVLYRLRKRKWEEGSIIYTREAEIVWVMAKKGLPVYYEAHTKPRWWKLHLWLVGQTAGIVAISWGLMGEYKAANFFSKRGAVIPDGVDLEKFNLLAGEQELKFKIREELGLLEEKKIILYVGSFQAWKGVDTLAGAAKILPGYFVVCFIGNASGSFKIKYEKEVKNGKIIFVGVKKREDIPLWMRAADVLVLPNSGKEDVSRLYTSPLKMFEYMASSRPIVASDLPSIREVLNEKTAFFFRADDAVDLAEKIKIALEDKVMAKKKAERALEEVKKYSWEERAKKVLEKIKIKNNKGDV